MVFSCSLLPFTTVLDRALEGPVCELKDWDLKFIAKATSAKVKEYNIRHDSENPIPSDDSLADDVYKAGFELALELGVYCTDTGRIIKIDETELKAVIKEGVSQCTYGNGQEEVLYYKRNPEDSRELIRCIGPYNTISEELMIPIHQLFMQSKYTQAVSCGLSDTVYGREIRAGTPWEVLASLVYARALREAARRAGRPGLSLWGTCQDATGMGHLSCWTPDGFNIYDHCIISMPCELKTNNDILSKVAQAVEHGWKIYAYTHPSIGGFVGGPEGAVVLGVAAGLLEAAVHRGTIIEVVPWDGWNLCGVSRASLWGLSVFQQAFSRNTNFMIGSDVDPNAGTFTKELLYEVANASICNTVSGATTAQGVRTGNGRYKDCTSPIEGYLMGEVCVATTGMKRADANEIIKKILPKYESTLKSPPVDKTFQDCYDVKKLVPKKEWMDMYQEVRKDLINIGVLL